MVAGNMFYVPWPDFSEWNNVREQIFSSNIQDTITAYRTILMWKLKYDSVPAYIECTYSLLQVMVKEYEMTKTEQNSLLFNEHDLQLSYSTALMRFVNHISSVTARKSETLYFAAKAQNIPDWIINMRHDVAHGQNLPALDALHVAAELSLKWLLDHYWGNTESCQQKVSSVSQVDLDSGSLRDVDVDVQNFFKKFFNIWDQYHTKWQKACHLKEFDRGFILQLEELLSVTVVYFNNVENEATKKLQSFVNAYNQMEENEEVSEDLCRVHNFKSVLFKFIKKIIKGNEQLNNPFVFSLTETKFLSEINFSPQKWQKILRLMQETGSFPFLLETLFQMAGNGYRAACKWLSVLLPSIKHLKKQWSIFKHLQKENKDLKIMMLKKKIRITYKPTEGRVQITLGIFRPPVISLEMVKAVLLNPEPFPVEDLTQYLELVKPPLPQSTVNMIGDLVSLHMAGNGREEPEEMDEDKVYTVDDLDRIMESEESLVVEKANGSNGWTRSSIGVDIWNKCPLGLLPFQTTINCSLPEDLTWERQPCTRKRDSIPLLTHSVSMKRFKQF